METKKIHTEKMANYITSGVRTYTFILILTLIRYRTYLTTDYDYEVNSCVYRNYICTKIMHNCRQSKCLCAWGSGAPHKSQNKQRVYFRYRTRIQIKNNAKKTTFIHNHTREILYFWLSFYVRPNISRSPILRHAIFNG